LGYFFQGIGFVLLTKDGFGYLWGIYSQTHLVTLLSKEELNLRHWPQSSVFFANVQMQKNGSCHFVLGRVFSVVE
jgi:hypothetical protein